MAHCIFQSFAETADPSHGAARVAALRRELAGMGLDGFIVPRADEHQGEYVPRNAERLAWLTGFTGSAGTAIVLTDRAAIFVDGRYTLQVRGQVDAEVISPVGLAEQTPEAWISANLRHGGKLGYDSWLLTPAQLRRFEQAAAKVGGVLVAVERNPVDAIWTDRPEAPLGHVNLHPRKYAGEDATGKLQRIAAELDSCDALLLSDPHAVAWAFNIRGADVSHTPLPLSYALVPKDGKPMLFVDGRKLSNAVRVDLAAFAEIDEPSRLLPTLHHLGQQKRKVRFDASSVAVALVRHLESAGGVADVGTDPVALLKATKNRAELKGARAAHLRDGAAMSRFLAWFDAEAPKGRLTEIAAAEALETFRRETGALKDVSFPSISAAGPNAAIPHYRVTEGSNRRIGKGIFLIDSGGQYEDGTTDITRTIAVGAPTALMRACFTRVLKGHIAISQAVFPAGTTGAQIDAFARRALWEAGLDFDHGTGHGVGSYLSVHEGPQRISKAGGVALLPGMILSNEPGYYRAGQWGIRIETLVVVEPRKIAGAERAMLGFETITLAPIDLRLVEPSMLDAGEKAWLNAYHERVREEIGPLVDAATRRWLTKATKPLRGR